jgi:hypothetical protein
MASKPVTHFEEVESEGNESDPERWAYALCGQEYYEEGTTDKRFVTCKRCLNRIKSSTPAQ